MHVPFFRYPHVFEQYQTEMEAELIRVARSGAYIMQEELRRFEDQLAEYCGVRHAIGVGNATDAIELNLRAADIGPGDEVILPAHTFIASAGAVKSVGADVVFAEIGPDHLIEPDDIEDRITDRTRAVMPTQLNGRTADMDRLKALSERHGLLLLEDSAQGLGSRFNGRMAGTFGAGGVYSFYPAKTLGALGDAGALVTNDAEWAQAVLELRDHGRSPSTGEIRRWGRNSRLDNLHAALLLLKLQHLDKEIATRRELAARYHDNLKHLDALLLPPPPTGEADGHFDVYQNYEVEAVDRDRLRRHLEDNGIGTILQWGGKAVHEFDALGIDQNLPRTEAVMRRSFLLPMNTSLAVEEIDYVSEKIVEFYGA